jgi:hypothetical protein
MRPMLQGPERDLRWIINMDQMPIIFVVSAAVIPAGTSPSAATPPPATFPTIASPLRGDVPVPLLTDRVIVVAGTECLSYLTKNTIVTGSMVVHVPREEAYATGINPVCHPIHNNGRFLPPWSTIGTTCNMDHLTTKTNHNVQIHNLTTKGMIIAIVAAIACNNANNINGKAVRMIG